MAFDYVIVGGGSAGATRAALATAIRAGADTIYHAVGTCKMGQDAMAVVDPQ